MSIAVTLAHRTAGYDFQLDATLLVLWGRNYVINIVIGPISTYSTLVSTRGAIHYLDEMNDATDLNGDRMKTRAVEGRVRIALNV